MKRALQFILLVLVILGGVALLQPAWLKPVTPYAPQFVQSWLSRSGGSQKASDSQRRGGGGPIAVSVATAKTGKLPVIERTYGQLQSPAVVQIASRITSQVTGVHVKEGQTVKAGDLLITLDDRVPQAALAKDKAALAKDQALLASATADLNRARTLAQKQAGTQQAYDQAVAAQRAAEANVAADQAAIDADTLQIGFTRITAPIDGRLGAIPVSVGDLVTSGQNNTNLMTLTQVKPLKVSFRLPESSLAALRRDLGSGNAVKVRVIQTGETKPRAEGVLDFVDSAVDPASGTIGLGATLANEDLALWPGQHVNVEVESAALAAPALVPTVAVQPGQQGSFVWLLKEDQTVEPRNVTVQRSEAGLSAIASGLQAGDRVVVEGQLRLTPGSKVKATELPETVASEGAPAGATAQ